MPSANLVSPTAAIVTTASSVRLSRRCGGAAKKANLLTIGDLAPLYREGGGRSHIQDANARVVLLDDMAGYSFPALKQDGILKSQGEQAGKGDDHM